MKYLLHPRNRYQGQYNLAALCQRVPALKKWIRITPSGEDSLDFSAPEAVRLLNQALLQDYYQLNWQLDEGFLSPAVPGRADVIHYLADLLAIDNHGQIPQEINALDIGCGANCIYPLIGYAEYGWRFTGSDISTAAIKSAQAIINSNQGLSRSIRVRHQADANKLFNKIIHKNEYYHVTLCNPPFHASLDAATTGTVRKNRNLNLKNETTLNFSGQEHELCSPGGELGFVSRMITESEQFSEQVGWFSCLISRQRNLPQLAQLLRKQPIEQQQVLAMGQGNKQSRLLVWSYQTQRRRAKNYRLNQR